MGALAGATRCACASEGRAIACTAADVRERVGGAIWQTCAQRSAMASAHRNLGYRSDDLRLRDGDVHGRADGGLLPSRNVTRIAGKHDRYTNGDGAARRVRNDVLPFVGEQLVRDSACSDGSGDAAYDSRCRFAYGSYRGGGHTCACAFELGGRGVVRGDNFLLLGSKT